MSDDTPTERFTPPAPAVEPGTAAATRNTKTRSKVAITTLAVVGGALLIIVVVLLTLLFARGTGGVDPEPSNGATPDVAASQTPSESPNEAPTTAPSTPPNPSSPPVSTGPVFESFSPSNNSSVGCDSDSGSIPVTFTWSSTGATEAAIGVGTSDAFAAPYQTGLPPSGSFDLDYQCSVSSQTYTVSIRGLTGQTNKTILLTR